MKRLLLVEDEQVNRELFQRRLERKGYTVIPAENGLQAVGLTKQEKPDLVLMDLGLPDIDGWEATRRIKADRATAAIPVIVLSAHATPEAKEKAFAAGCQEFETKPVNWEVLYRKIEAELAKPKPPADDEVELGAPGGSKSDTGVIRAPKVATSASTMILPPGAGVMPLSSGTHPILPPEKEAGPVQPKQILVVEDNDANRVMLCRRLNRSGYETTEAANGREALDAVTKQRFDLVLCDIMMPEVDGFEVLKELKADPDLQAIPIIMISAMDEMASIVRCIEMGAEDYLQKPYDPVLLNARINACLDKRRLRDQEMEYLRAMTDLTQAAAMVEKGQFDESALVSVAARDDALGMLARVFSRMAREVQARVEQLKNDMQRMTKVEIDNREVVREVDRVTKSDAFNKARKHADEVRARRQQTASPPSAPRPASLADTVVMPKPRE